MARRWFVLPLLLFAAPLVAAPAPKAQPPRSLTDREADRQSPPPPWSGSGWRAVFPHAYAMLRRVQVRATPDAAAPVQFEIPGGMRVPIYEQRGAWWRIGGTKARAGWVRAAEMAPHARCVMLDAKTGRVLRQFATKGQWSVLPRNDALWALADTGLTRVAWDGGPHFWSHAVKGANADGNIELNAAWTSDQVALPGVADGGSPKVFSLENGSSHTVKTDPALGTWQRADLLSGYLTSTITKSQPRTRLFDPFADRVLPAEEGVTLALDRSGHRAVLFPGLAGKPNGAELRLLGKNGEVRGKWKTGAEDVHAVFTPDGRYLAVAESAGEGNGYRTAILTVPAMTRVVELHRPSPETEESGSAIVALATTASGWTGILADAFDLRWGALTRWDRKGRIVSHRSVGGGWALSDDGRAAFAALPRQIERVNLHTGEIVRIPFSWRTRLITRNLPPTMQNNPHWAITHLALSPDQRTLIVLERLDGDPEG